ncbi:3'-5' exoribonuclease YhaM family protein [Spiroplasma endosymbiont of Labia minor]|uniref:3'-5' exoribonuclease YhaM family protein n=1 Tax=Spiroplasma endosymbiont of Labia minor TaxID=3066305 RepID=UPI0030D53BC7
MQILNINDKQKGAQIKIIARIERAISNVGSNGLNYLILHLIDSTGRVEARLWSASEENKQELIPDLIGEFTCIVNIYHNQIQLKIENFKIFSADELKEKDISIADFAISAPINSDKVIKKMQELFATFKNKTYKGVVLGVIEKYKKILTKFPAAISIHHNVISGLLWHSTSLVEAARGLISVYKYAEIDWELVQIGAFLHDIGKIFEITSVNGSDYSLEGKLLGHISIGNAMIISVAKNRKLYYLDDEKNINPDFVLLQHVILSSHGKKDFGSPVEPNLIEAVIVSTLDNLDSRIYKINDELKKVELNTWTSRLMTEDGKMFYKHLKNDTTKNG